MLCEILNFFLTICFALINLIVQVKLPHIRLASNEFSNSEESLKQKKEELMTW